MTQAEDYDIVGSYNNQIFSPIDAERSINCYAYLDPLGKKKKSLVYTSGLINGNFVFPNAANGFRAQFVFNNIQYVVIGANVYSITTAGVVSQLNPNNKPLATTVGYVGIDANSFQIIFVDGQNGYIYDTITSIFSEITDSSFPDAPNGNPIDVCYLDGFFVVANGETNTFQLSMFNQGLVWGPDYTSGTGNGFLAASSGSPDLILSSGTTLNYQTGTPIQFNGATLPTGTPAITAGVTYYVKTVVNSTTFTISVTNGGTAITFATTGSSGDIFVTNSGQLQLGEITSHPGTIVACRTLHRRLFLFSQFFTEVWENAGVGSNLPFRRNNALLMEYGCPCIGSIAVDFDIMCFQSQTRGGLGAVMEVSGTQPIPISTSALDAQLSLYAAKQQMADCRAFLIKENNLIFYRMNWTLANHTFVYNITQSDPTSEATKMWHEEEILTYSRHPAQTHAYFNGMNYVGDYASPILYIMDRNTYNNNGQSIRRARITKAFYPPGGNRIRIDRLQIDLLQGNIAEAGIIDLVQDISTEDGLILLTESGLDIETEQDFMVTNPITPILFMSISKDGGQTYGYSTPAPLGFIGQRTFRTVYRKLGTTKRGQSFVIKLEFYDQVPFVCMGASWAMETLPE